MKIFLAGLNARPSFFNEAGSEKIPRFCLESFYSFKKWEHHIIHEADEFILDSGAFTYMQKNNVSDVNWFAYAEEYANFVLENNIRNYVELDIDSIIGYEKVLELRKFLEDKTNRPCMPVWHLWRGKDDFKRMIEEYDYACIGGFVSNAGGGILTSANKMKYIAHFISEAHSNNCRLHGLGCTRTSSLTKLKFDSVDSTSWLSGARYGQIHQFDGKRIKVYPKPKNTRIKNYMALDTFNLRQWQKYQDYAFENL